MDSHKENGDTSRLILSTASVYQSYLTDFATRTGRPNPVFVDSLDAKVAEQYAVLVISDLSESTRGQITPILQTPIVYLGKEIGLRDAFPLAQTIEEAIKYAREQFNIHSVAVLAQNHDQEISQAYDLKQQWLAIFKALSPEIREQLITAQYDPPRFNSLLEKTRNAARPDTVTLVKSFANPDDIQALVVSAMRAYDENPNDENTERAKQRVLALRTKFSPTLGESQVGDGGAKRIGRVLRNYGEMSWRISRIVVDKKKERYAESGITYETITHHDIAEQRYKDSRKFFKDDRFNTPVILRPLDLGETGSFILMQDIEGPTVDQVLRKVADELDKNLDNKRKSLLRSVRAEIVKKAIGDIAIWQTSAPKTFMPKQSTMVLPSYKNRIGALTDILTRTNETFSEEELLLLLYSHDVLDSLDCSARNVVRIRDAAMQNYVMQFDSVKFDPQTGSPIFTIEDLLRNTTMERDGKQYVDPEKIQRKLFNVDLAYHWGHIMEDVAHFITAPEYPYFRDRKTRRQHIDDFFSNIARPDLSSEETSQELMAYFRAARKIVLNATTYIGNVVAELSRGEISPYLAQKRKKRIDANIRSLAGTAKEVMRSLYTRRKTEAYDEFAIIRPFIDLPFDITMARQIETLGNSASETARQRIQAFTLYKIYEKLVGYLTSNDVTKLEGRK